MKKVCATSMVGAALLMAGLVSVGSSAAAGMQWKWRDANGVSQYSDRPPPPGTPEQNILARPPASRAMQKAAQAASAAASAASTAPGPSGASASKPDAELEARRKKAEDEKLAKQKAEDEKAAKSRAENCERAQAYKRSLQEGMRIARTNANGEREVLDDKARADETQRAQEAIQANCK